MARRLTVEEAKGRVVDAINLLQDAASANVEKYMDKYAALRDLEGEEREEAYKDICFSLFGAYRDEVGADQGEEASPDQEEEAGADQKGEAETETLPPDQEGSEDAFPVAPGAGSQKEEGSRVKTRRKLEKNGFSLVLPPRADLAPAEETKAPVDPLGLFDRILAFWDGITATCETAWEMYLAPLVALLLSLFGITWRGAKRAAILARTGARRALPLFGACLIHVWGFVSFLALLGGKMAICGFRASGVAARRIFKAVTVVSRWGAKGSILAARKARMMAPMVARSLAAVSREALLLGARAGAVIREEISQGWKMREELNEEWREAAA